MWPTERLTAETTALGTVSYSYDNAGRRQTMTAFGSQTLSYDANGNLTSDGTNSYTWDARNHLVAVAGPVSASFTYDALGRRVSKTVAGVTTQFLYDGLNPVQELDGASPPNVTANLLAGLGGSTSTSSAAMPTAR